MIIKNIDEEFIRIGKAQIAEAVRFFMETGETKRNGEWLGNKINMAVRMVLHPGARMACSFNGTADIYLKHSNGIVDELNYVQFDGMGHMMDVISGICPARVEVIMHPDTEVLFTASAHPAHEDEPFVCVSKVMGTAVCQLFLLVFAEELARRLA